MMAAQFPEHDDVLTSYTIYDRPSDHPEGFVVRQWFITGNGVEAGISHLFPTLEAARAAIPVRGRCIPWRDGDDPIIVETWI